MDVAKRGNHSDKTGKIDRKIDSIGWRIEKIWCICCRDQRDKVVLKGCVGSG